MIPVGLPRKESVVEAEHQQDGMPVFWGILWSYFSNGHLSLPWGLKTNCFTQSLGPKQRLSAYLSAFLSYHSLWLAWLPQPSSSAFKLQLVLSTEGNLSKRQVVYFSHKTFSLARPLSCKKIEAQRWNGSVRAKWKGKSESVAGLLGPCCLQDFILLFVPAHGGLLASALLRCSIGPSPWCVVHFRYPEDIGILRTLSPLPDRAFYCILFIPRGTVHCQVPSLTLPLFSELPGGLTESSLPDFWKNKKQKIPGAGTQTTPPAPPPGAPPPMKQGRAELSSGLKEKEKHTEFKSELHPPPSPPPAQHSGALCKDLLQLAF